MAITKVSRGLLNTGVSDSSDSTAITINSSEQVGIGETSPLGKLHVKTADSGGSADSGADELVLENSGAAGITILSGTANSGSVRFGDSDDNDNGMLVYNHGSSPYMRFFTGGSVRVRLDADGLKFGSDTAAANALDDYEEGTYTPTSGASLTVTYANYTKIGRLVFLNADITVGSTSGSSAFAMTLPFNSVDNYYSGLVQYNNVPEPQLAANISTTALYFRKLDTSFASLTYTGVSGHRFIFSIVYTSAT